MLLTLYYMTSTCIQSWRLNSIKNTFTRLFSNRSSIVLYKEKTFLDTESSGNYESLALHLRGVTSDYCINKANAHLFDLWCYKAGKRGCSVIPEQNVNISNWISVPDEKVYFPVHLRGNSDLRLNGETLSVLIEINFCFADGLLHKTVCELENYGIPKAWTANEYFAMILETDIDHLTELARDFMMNDLFLNCVMELIRLETVNVYGNPCELLHVNKIPILIHSLNENADDVNDSIVDETSKTFHVRVLKKIAQSADELQKSQANHFSLDYPSVVLVKHNFSKSTTRKSLTESTTSLVKNADVSPRENSRCNDCHGCYENMLDNNIRTRSNSKTCSLGIASCGSETAVVQSLNSTPFNSVDQLDCSKSSMTSLSLAETTSLTENAKKIITPVRHRGEGKTGKPPNILIFSESPSSIDNIKVTLKTVLRKHRYTVYSLTLNEMLKSPWTQQATLVVVCGNVPASLKPLLFQYLLNNGGNLLCLCSDLLGVFLPTFKTAEVRPDELVTFSYSKWKRLTLLHHIFCYQPSPKTSKFSADESPSSGTVPMNVPTVVELLDANNEPHTLRVEVLASEETWQTPTLLSASEVDNGGRILFSQVHLEVDPKLDDKKSYDPKLRLALLSDLLSKYLGLECDTSEMTIKYTLGYFLGKHERKLEFLQNMTSHLRENELQMKNITLKFLGVDTFSLEATDRFLPIMLYDCPSNFSTVEYFENLKTKHLGRLVLYSEVMTSSMNVLNGPLLEHGLVVISRQQTSGVGRGGNAWISPDGCAMFSMQLHVPLISHLGQRLSLLQHIIALSIVSAICSLPEYEDLNLGLKWPNDIYAGGMAKVGGLIITSSIVNSMAICNAGCALNLSNSLPTTCVNDMIVEMCDALGRKLPTLSLEKYFACVFSKLEELLDIVQSGKVDVVFDLYYKYWLHSLAEVKIAKPDGSSQAVTIIGIDDSGFLKVRDGQGNVFVVLPDYNTFDMMSGLIAPK